MPQAVVETVESVPQREADCPRPLAEVPKGWIPVSQAATLLGCDAATVYRRLGAGVLRGGEALLPGGRSGLFVDAYSDERLARVIADPVLSETPSAADLARLSHGKRRTAALRLRAVESWLSRAVQIDPGEREGTIRDIYKEWRAANWQTLGIREFLSYTTMWRWRCNYLRGRAVGLAPRQTGPIAREPSPQAWALFQALYLTKQKRTVRDCWRQTTARAEREGWTWISYARCQARVERDIPPAVACLHREGEKAHEDAFVPWVERDYEAIRPNDWWVCDHRELDIMALGADGKPHRPWLTRWMDVKSRKVVGRMIHDGPNSDIVLASFRRAVLDYGCPHHALMDNGKDFIARTVAGGHRKIAYRLDELRVRAAFSTLPIQCHFAQPYNAKAKPVERSFRTMSLQFDREFETWLGSNPQERPEGSARALAELVKAGKMPDFDLVAKALAEWEDHVYGEAGHRGQGMNGRSPNEVYREELEVVQRVPERELMMCLMRSSEPRAVFANGISMWGRWFAAPELFGLAGKGKCCYVRYDPAKVGELFVFDLQDRYLCAARRTDLVAWGATGEDLRARMKLKAQRRKIARAMGETDATLFGGTGDAVHNIALQRQAREAEATKRAVERPDPKPPGGESLPAIRIVRTAMEEAAREVARLPKAAGMEAGSTGFQPVQHGLETRATKTSATIRMTAREFFGVGVSGGGRATVPSDDMVDARSPSEQPPAPARLADDEFDTLQI